MFTHTECERSLGYFRSKFMWHREKKRRRRKNKWEILVNDNRNKFLWVKYVYIPFAHVQIHFEWGPALKIIKIQLHTHTHTLCGEHWEKRTFKKNQRTFVNTNEKKRYIFKCPPKLMHQALDFSLFDQLTTTHRTSKSSHLFIIWTRLAASAAHRAAHNLQIVQFAFQHRQRKLNNKVGKKKKKYMQTRSL